MGVEENKAAIARSFDAFNAGDVEAFVALYAPDSVSSGFGPEPVDREWLREFYAMVRAAFPDGELRVEDQIGEGDLVSIRYSLRGTHQGGDFMGIPPTGRPVAVSAQTILRFSEGKIVERWQNGDLFGLLTQLGAIPARSG